MRFTRASECSLRDSRAYLAHLGSQCLCGDSQDVVVAGASATTGSATVVAGPCGSG